MNFEQLIKCFVDNYDKIPNKKKALDVINNEYEILQLKKEKLKLGKVTFEFKYHYFGEVLLFEELEMVYCRQDNTDENERKIENLLDYYSWKWDFNNIGAFIILAYFAYSCLKLFILQWLQTLPFDFFMLFSTALVDDIYIKTLIEYSFSLLADNNKIFKFYPFYEINFFMYDILTQFIVKFQVI